MKTAAWLVSGLLLGACGSGDSGAGREFSSVLCADGLDNDGDGRIDCADADCRSFAFCGGSSDGGVLDMSAIRDSDIVAPDWGTTNECSDALDVVFVLDVSTTMADDLARIRSGIGAVWDAALALSPSAQFSMVVFVDDAVAVDDCTPFPTKESLASAFDYWSDFCSDNASPVSGVQNGDCAENSLDALYIAATECPWRSPSTRLVVHVTDDTFAERPTELSGEVPVQRSYDEVVNILTDNEIRVGAFAVPNGNRPSWCSTSGTIGNGFFTPWNGNIALPNVTGGRAWNILETRDGRLDMQRAITELVNDEFCTLY
jgi:hypothetical protein